MTKKEDLDDRIQAFLQWLEENGENWEDQWEDLEDIEPTKYDDTVFEFDGKEYMILTDDEADERFNEYQESLLEECILSEIPKNLRYYFDSEKYIKDVRRMDGRGSSLAGYDGEENETKLGNEWYYIYRVN